MFNPDKLRKNTNMKTVERTCKRILDDTGRDVGDRWSALEWLAKDRVPGSFVSGNKITRNGLVLAENLGYTVFVGEHLVRKIFGKGECNV